MSFKIDLHTHSIVSYDGGLTAKQYAKVMQKNLDVVAITDHNILATNISAQPGLEQATINGEEIATLQGDIIGLYLTKQIEPGLSLEKAIQEIKEQNGLVYIPHPFEKQRRGLQQIELDKIKNQIDIVEVFNARTRNKVFSELAMQFAKNNHLAMASSSDAHGIYGIGGSYVEISEMPDRTTLVALLKQGKLVCRTAAVLGHMHPLYNKVKKYFINRHG